MNWQPSNEICKNCGQPGFVGQTFCAKCGHPSSSSDEVTQRSSSLHQAAPDPTVLPPTQPAEPALSNPYESSVPQIPFPQPSIDPVLASETTIADIQPVHPSQLPTDPHIQTVQQPVGSGQQWNLLQQGNSEGQLGSGQFYTNPQQPVQQKKGLTRNKIITIIIASLLILISVASFAGYQQHKYQEGLNATATAQSQETQVAIDNSNATATQQSIQRTAVAATAYAKEINTNPYVPGDNSTLFINDTLQGSYGMNWGTLLDSEKKIRCDVGNTGYQVNTTAGNAFGCPTKGPGVFKNLTFEVTMKINGDCGGFLIRNNGLGTTGKLDGYIGLLCTNGTYALFAAQNGNINKLLQKGFIGVNAENTIAVTAKEQHLHMFINKQSVFELDDSTFTTSGKVGLVAASLTQSTTVTFTNTKVWQLI